MRPGAGRPRLLRGSRPSCGTSWSPTQLPSPAASAWRSSPSRRRASPRPGPCRRTRRGRRTPPCAPGHPAADPNGGASGPASAPGPAGAVHHHPCRSPFRQPSTFTSAGMTRSAFVGWNRTPCSFLRTPGDGLFLPFMIWERFAELMPARRAASFWLKPWAFIRSHTASRLMQAGCAGATFAGASSADSILAWTFTPMLL